ncbi:tail protein X [Microbulbifer sp. VTAC004]|uniref:tail protein X n=1 Tax=Microbulbifer sp. VTAC004 TaxID=3243386 RepID=UPI00403941D1
MITDYRTRAGDVLDQVCKSYYGRESAVPEVLEANPKLALLPSVLPEGVRIILPELSDAKVKSPMINLWD